METKHTKGEWRTLEMFNGVSILKEDTIIAKVNYLLNEHESEANAKLIAAAPKMINYLIKRLKSFKNLKEQRDLSTHETEQLNEVLELIKEATE